MTEPQLIDLVRELPFVMDVSIELPTPGCVNIYVVVKSGIDIAGLDSEIAQILEEYRPAGIVYYVICVNAADGALVT